LGKRETPNLELSLHSETASEHPANKANSSLFFSEVKYFRRLPGGNGGFTSAFTSVRVKESSPLLVYENTCPGRRSAIRILLWASTLSVFTVVISHSQEPQSSLLRGKPKRTTDVHIRLATPCGAWHPNGEAKEALRVLSVNDDGRRADSKVRAPLFYRRHRPITFE